MQYTLSTSKCNSNEPNKRFLAIPYENVSNIKKPKILNSDANRIIFLHSTVDWVLHGKILNYFDGKVFFKTSAKCEKKKIQIHSREHCSVFQQCGNLFFSDHIHCHFSWTYTLHDSHAFRFGSCNLPDMQARYLQRVLTVILQSTLHDFKYCRSCFLKERFL